MPERHDTLRHWLALIRAPHVGPATFHSLLERFGSPEAVFAASRPALAEAGLKPASLDYLQDPDWSAVDADLRWQDAGCNHILLRDDAAYPALLRETADPPPLLYVVGDVEVLNRKQLAMVGSRNPTPAGRETARRWASMAPAMKGRWTAKA